MLCNISNIPQRYLNLEQIKQASRLEEEFQVEIWGVVEGGHDMDRLNNSVNLSSVSFFQTLVNGADGLQAQINSLDFKDVEMNV